MKMKTIDAAVAYNALNAAKLTKMDDADKVKVLKTLRNLKAVATPYFDFVRDAEEKMKPEGYDGMQRKAQQWQAEGQKTTLTAAEQLELDRFFKQYRKSVDEAAREEGDKEVEVKIGKLSEDAFQKLVASNDWKAEELLKLDIML